MTEERGFSEMKDSNRLLSGISKREHTGWMEERCEEG